jgi:hypothetical protein
VVQQILHVYIHRHKIDELRKAEESLEADQEEMSSSRYRYKYFPVIGYYVLSNIFFGFTEGRNIRNALCVRVPFAGTLDELSFASELPCYYCSDWL